MTSFTMYILYRLKPLMRQSSMDSYRQRIFSLSFSFRMHIYTILNMHEGRSIVQLKCNLSYALSPTIRHCIKWPTKSMVCVNTRIEKIYTTIRTRTPQLYTQMSTLQTQFNRKIIIMR